jgi:ankyrin repeat protein
VPEVVNNKVEQVKQVEQKINKPEPQTIATKKEKDVDIVPGEMSEAARKFAEDEVQVLFLPNDDIVLGSLTEQAKIDQMDAYSYIKLFQKNEEWVANSKRRKIVKDFIKYNDNIDKERLHYANLPYFRAVEDSFEAVRKNNLFALRALLDVYPILQEKGPNGDTLLITATRYDNYYLAKFLVIRGIQISRLDADCQNAADIALAQCNDNIVCMLAKAGGVR